jgi:hypothetical protein
MTDETANPDEESGYECPGVDDCQYDHCEVSDCCGFYGEPFECDGCGQSHCDNCDDEDCYEGDNNEEE